MLKLVAARSNDEIQEPILVNIREQRGRSSAYIYVVESLGSKTVNFALPLARGWNLVSLPIGLDDWAMESALAGVLDNIVLVKNGAGYIFWPSYGINTIGEWRLTDGYQVYMGAAGELDVVGYGVFSPDVDYELGENWSLIGFVGPDGLPPSEAFSDILDSLIVVKNGDGDVFWPEYEVDDIGGLVHGEGYWVYLTSPATFSFPAALGKHLSMVSAERQKTVHFQSVTNTGNNATILVKVGTAFGNEVYPLKTGDEIGVFNDSGLCVGAAVWEAGKNCTITVWGDDTMTDEIDGIRQGAKYRFMIWEADPGVEFEASPWYESGSPTYTPNALVVLGSLYAGGVSVKGGANPLKYSLAGNYPNPFNPTTTISFTIPGDSRVTLTVYNITGEKVAILADDILPAGSHSVEWNAAGLSSGVYFCRMTAGTFRETKRMMLLK